MPIMNSRSASVARVGAQPTPQFPVTTVVTPAGPLGDNRGSETNTHQHDLIVAPQAASMSNAMVWHYCKLKPPRAENAPHMHCAS